MKFPRADGRHWSACFCLLGMKTALDNQSQDSSGGAAIKVLYHCITKSGLSYLHHFLSRLDGDPLNALAVRVPRQAASAGRVPPALSGTLPPCRAALLPITATVAVLFPGTLPTPPSSRQSTLGLREQRTKG